MALPVLKNFDMYSVMIRRQCAGRDTAHLIPESAPEALREEDWLRVPLPELDRQIKTQCTRCFLTFDISRESAMRQQKEMCVTVEGAKLAADEKKARAVLRALAQLK